MDDREDIKISLTHRFFINFDYVLRLSRQCVCLKQDQSLLLSFLDETP